MTGNMMAVAMAYFAKRIKLTKLFRKLVLDYDFQFFWRFICRLFFWTCCRSDGRGLFGENGWRSQWESERQFCGSFCISHRVQLACRVGCLVVLWHVFLFRENFVHMVSDYDVRIDRFSTCCGKYVYHPCRHLCRRNDVGAICFQLCSGIFRKCGGRSNICKHVLLFGLSKKVSSLHLLCHRMNNHSFDGRNAFFGI